MKKEKRKDVTVVPNAVQVNLTDGLEGPRSKCCYAPAVETTEPGMIVCSKCKEYCELLTEKEKTAINKKAKEAINNLLARTCIATVIYKPTNDFVASKLKVPHVASFAEACVKKYQKDHPKLNVRIEDFVVVEHEGDEIRVTALKLTPKSHE